LADNRAALARPLTRRRAARGNQYSIEFERLYQSGATMLPSVAVPESKKEQKAAVKTAAALGGDTWKA
jgi:hypothetical protein